MKQFIPIILLFITIQLHGQGLFTISPNPSEADAETIQNFFNAEAELNVNVDSSFVVNWKRTIIDIPQGWDVQICLNSTCLASNVSEGEVELIPGYSTSFSNTFYPNEISGIGRVEVELWLAGDTTSKVTQVYIGNVLPTSIELNKKENSIELYPNPVSTTFRLSEYKSLSKIELYSSTGQLIRTFLQNENYNVSDLPNGIYYLKTRNEQNIVLGVKYFIKN